MTKHSYLHIVALVVEARLSEKAMLDHSVDIEHVEHRVGIL